MPPARADFCAFDIEYCDASAACILCCALVAYEGGARSVVRTFGAHPFNVCMTPAETCEFIDALYAFFVRGIVLVSWGGTGADFRILADAAAIVSPAHAQQARMMALEHVDIALAVAASMASMPGLRAACEGMALGAKDAGASARVPALWAMGLRAQVLAHVEADADATAAVYARMFDAVEPADAADAADADADADADAHIPGVGSGVGVGASTECGDEVYSPAPTCTGPRLTWITVRGAVKTWRAPFTTTAAGARLLTVRECLQLPPPRYALLPHLEPKALAAWIFT